MKIIEGQSSKQIVSQLLRSNLQEDVSSTVAEIISNVRRNGDSALCEYTSKFDGIVIQKPEVMSYNELEKYVYRTNNKLDERRKTAINTAIQNVDFVAKESTPQSWSKKGPQGQKIGEIFKPFSRVACYVPQGSFPLVSTAIHTAAIARAVGVAEIVMITSPKDEELNPAVAYAAFNSGVTEIVFTGGAQGIAALAYGTQSIKKADFICGPGNSYVANAKKQLFGQVGIDMVAGPSEVFVIANNESDAYCVACDLVAQAEHGSGYEAAVLLTDSRDLLVQVESELKIIKDCIENNPGFEKVFNESIYLVLVNSIDDAIYITNECAPEHVEIMTSNANDISTKISNAGAIFIGRYSAEPLGDFVAGPSHVLPTNSTARFTSGLSAASFMKRTSVIEIDDQAYAGLAELAEEFGEMEGLTGHAMSSVARIDKRT